MPRPTSLADDAPDRLRRPASPHDACVRVKRSVDDQESTRLGQAHVSTRPLRSQMSTGDRQGALTRARLVLAGFGWRVFLRRYFWQVLALVLSIGLAGSVLAVGILAVSDSSSAAANAVQPFSGALGAVPTNHVTGSGTVSVRLRGRTATITLTTRGLLNGSPHLAHIHGLGLGTCPTARNARLHNGHLAVSTGDAIRLYGSTLVSFTEWGSTSGAAPNNIDMDRYPASGSLRYGRTMTVAPLVADLIRDNDAVVVVHGIDYNYNHIYDFKALGVSDLDKTLPGEATAPALCGPLRAAPATKSVSANLPTTYVASLRLETTPEYTWPRVSSSATYSAPASRGLRELPQMPTRRRLPSAAPSPS